MVIKTFRVYLRITKNGLVKASRKPIFTPLSNELKYNRKFYSTIAIALDLKIDEKEFDAAKILLEQEIKNSIPAIQIAEKEKDGREQN
jgi:hypothetical protein